MKVTFKGQYEDANGNVYKVIVSSENTLSLKHQFEMFEAFLKASGYEVPGRIGFVKE